MKQNSYLLTVVVLFVVVSAAVFGLKQSRPEFSFNVLMTGNVLMGILAFVSFAIVRKQVHERPQAFVRSVYSATFLKLMVCMVALLVYVLLDRPHVHKPSLFVLCGIYVVYTTVETVFLQRLARQQK